MSENTALVPPQLIPKNTRETLRLAVDEYKGRQLLSCRIWFPSRDGEWRGLADIAETTDDPPASVSARLRDLRRWGFRIERRYIQRGLWHYRMAQVTPASGAA